MMHPRLRRTLSRRFAIIVVMAALLAVASAGRCYPAGTRVVIFVQGLYTTLDAGGTQGTLVETHRFDTLKQTLASKGYAATALLDASYAGGTVTASGTWAPAPYDCTATDRTPADNLKPLEQMMMDYKKKNPGAHFALVGHSLGGYLAFLEGAREAGRSPEERLGIDVVVTLDAPLSGVNADKKTVIDIIPCDKTYVAGGDLVATGADPRTPDVRRYQAWAMAAAGIRLATYGNRLDCLYNLRQCLAGPWADDTGTQFLEGQAAVSQGYYIQSSPLGSHDAILGDATAMKDAATFIGAP